MRIAIMTKNGKIAPMDEGENAMILDNDLESKVIDLGEYEDHPGLQKMMDLLRKEPTVDVIITERCGPPCIRLAANKGKKIYFYSGESQDAVSKLLEGKLKEATEDDAMRTHGMHRHEHHHH